MGTRDSLYYLAGRCTESAWEAIKALRDDPDFFEAVAAALAKKPGTIVGLEVENARAEVAQRLQGSISVDPANSGLERSGFIERRSAERRRKHHDAP